MSNVVLLADEARGLAAAQHAVKSWPVTPTGDWGGTEGQWHSVLAVLKQGKNHRDYMECWDDLDTYGQITFLDGDGKVAKVWRVVTIEGNVFGYVPGTEEAEELLSEL